MAVLLKKLWMSYHLISEELPDPRTKSWLLVMKPHEGLPILAIYILFVLKWGPKWMKDRPPFNIDILLIIHNAVQVLANSYIFYECLAYGWALNYRWVCEPVDYSDSPQALKVAGLVYHYYLTKYLDLLDTVFFVLRKKFNQISFLHVFHHANMVIVSWGATTFFPGGHGTFVGLLNSFVHVMMYSYYLLAVIRPSTKNSLWWKKYLTQLQIVQLAMTCVHFGLLLITSNCKYPWWIALAILPGDLFLLGLFVDFYIQTYIYKKNKTIDISTNGSAASESGPYKESVESNGNSCSNSELRHRGFEAGFRDNLETLGQ